MPARSSARSRRGRPSAGEHEAHRRRVLDAAFDVLVENGFEKVTMLSIARRAGASKETLYSWFGNRDGLFAAMIVDNADAAAERVRIALDAATDSEVGGDPRATLTDFGAGLLALLTNERSVALNRAAMVVPSLAGELLASGRHRVGPIVEEYLASLAAAGLVRIDDPADAFEVFYGLLVRDTQIRVLLGERPPSRAAIRRRAQAAVRDFFDLVT